MILITQTSSLNIHGFQEILDYIMGFTAEGNLDCIHPAQTVLDLLCGANNGYYAEKLETFFESYADMRGLKSKMFKPMSSCVYNLVWPEIHLNSFTIFSFLAWNLFCIKFIHHARLNDNWLAKSKLIHDGRNFVPSLWLRPSMRQAMMTPWSCRWQLSSHLVFIVVAVNLAKWSQWASVKVSNSDDDISGNIKLLPLKLLINGNQGLTFRRTDFRA